MHLLRDLHQQRFYHGVRLRHAFLCHVLHQDELQHHGQVLREVLVDTQVFPDAIEDRGIPFILFFQLSTEHDIDGNIVDCKSYQYSIYFCI